MDSAFFFLSNTNEQTKGSPSLWPLFFQGHGRFLIAMLVYLCPLQTQKNVAKFFARNLI